MCKWYAKKRMKSVLVVMEWQWGMIECREMWSVSLADMWWRVTFKLTSRKWTITKTILIRWTRCVVLYKRGRISKYLLGKKSLTTNRVRERRRLIREIRRKQLKLSLVGVINWSSTSVNPSKSSNTITFYWTWIKRITLIQAEMRTTLKEKLDSILSRDGESLQYTYSSE